jgi:hypothetical protein
MHNKFDTLWFGPYKIEDKSGTNSFYLSHLDGKKIVISCEWTNVEDLFF